MSIRVGINAAITFVRVNDPAGDAATVAHLLNVDSVHGRWEHQAGADDDALAIDGARIAFTRNREFAATDWSGCDVVIESSGRFRKPEPDVLQPYRDQGVDAWYDNEWGCANRTAELVRLVGNADR